MGKVFPAGQFGIAAAERSRVYHPMNATGLVMGMLILDGPVLRGALNDTVP